MRFPRISFSLRTLLIAITAAAVLLGLFLRYAEHLEWWVFHSHVAAGLEPIPTKPLIVPPPEEVFALCRIGPVSFEVPQSMTGSIENRRGLGGAYFQFFDDDRALAVLLPHTGVTVFQQELAEFPEMAKLTFSRLQIEIAAARAGDFSFAMSRRELRWHKWLVTYRDQISPPFHSIEYLRRPELEGNLFSYPKFHRYSWETADFRWTGSMTFTHREPNRDDWVRRVCDSFAIHGAPEELSGRTDDELREMLAIVEAELAQ